MKRVFLTVFALCLFLLFSCAYDGAPSSQSGIKPPDTQAQQPSTKPDYSISPDSEKDNSSDDSDAPSVFVTPDNIEIDNSDISMATPDTIKPNSPKPLSKTYTSYNNVDTATVQASKDWVQTLGGLPGFTASAQYDEENDCYIISEGMGAFQLIEKIEFAPTHIKVYFISGVKMHKYMTDIPDYIAINSSQIKVTSPDGNEYTSTVYNYTYSGKGKLDTASEQVTLTFPIGTEITERVQDIFISCGKVD